MIHQSIRPEAFAFSVFWLHVALSFEAISQLSHWIIPTASRRGHIIGKDVIIGFFKFLEETGINQFLFIPRGGVRIDYRLTEKFSFKA